MYTLSHSIPNFKSFSCSMSYSNCHFLTYKQTFQETGKVIWYAHFLKNFPQFVVVHTMKDFRIVSEADRNDFLGFPCFLYDPMNVGNLIADSSNQFAQLEVLSWGLAWRISSFTLLASEMSAIAWYVEHSLKLPFFWIGWNLTYSWTLATAEFSKLLTYWMQSLYRLIP